MKEKQWRSIINERELEIKIRDPGIELEGGEKKDGKGILRIILCAVGTETYYTEHMFCGQALDSMAYQGEQILAP